MTDQEWEKWEAALAESQQETARQLRETGELLKEVGRKLDRLGEKFGSFTEGLALPSMTRILREGIYLARVHDGHFEVQVPESFQPRAF